MVGVGRSEWSVAQVRVVSVRQGMVSVRSIGMVGVRNIDMVGVRSIGMVGVRQVRMVGMIEMRWIGRRALCERRRNVDGCNERHGPAGPQ